MKTSRRAFLTLGAAAAAATILQTPAWAAITRKISLPLSEAEQRLLAFVGAYGGNARFVGQGVLEKLRFGSSRHLHVLVEVEDLGSFEQALASLPFTGAYATGSELAFEAGGTEFTVENLPIGTFAERRMILMKARHVAFAHDAISYDPATGTMLDPFNATRARVVRTINRAFGQVEGVKVILRGLIEAQQLELPLGADFQRWKNRLLRFTARSKDSDAIASGILNLLASAADALPEETIAKILGSRCVKSALAEARGIDVDAVIAAAKSLRAAQPGSVANSAVWLSLLLKQELEAETSTGVLTSTLQHGNRFQVLRSRKALAQARQLLAV